MQALRVKKHAIQAVNDVMHGIHKTFSVPLKELLDKKKYNDPLKAEEAIVEFILGSPSLY